MPDARGQVIAPLLRVLVVLHRQHILHRDIKPENLFLTCRRAMVLGDFGLAIRCDEELPFTRSGTLDYMAPEVCNPIRTQNPNPDPMPQVTSLGPQSQRLSLCALHPMLAVGLSQVHGTCSTAVTTMHDLCASCD